MAKDNIVFAFLGSSLDMGYADKRWERWRPTPALVGHDDELPLTEIVLMYTSTDHEQLLKRVVCDILEKCPVVKVTTRMLETPDPWDFPAMYAALFDLFSAYNFDTSRNNYYLQQATGTHVSKICMFLLAEARIAPAQLLTTRPFSTDELPGKDAWRGKLHIVDLSRERYDVIASRFASLAETHGDVLRNGIATRNQAFNEMITEVEQVATRSSAPMLITGPTGAGKSQLASRIFELRRHNNLIEGEFVEVNCATLRGDNALSTLFGHKKGAFTGAVADRQGVLQRAHKGIAFLDEAGELGLEEQAMLLKALEDKRFTPLGSDKPVRSDFELIVGTNKDLVAEVAAGRFREDLLARLNVWTFRLPGLAERKEDIEPNIEFELRRQCKNLNRLISFNSEARKAYLDYAMSAPWSGNFRDLGASIERMATLANGGRIDLPLVQRELKRLLANESPRKQQGNSPSKLALPAVNEQAPLVTKLLGAVEAGKMPLLKRVELDFVLQHVCAANSVTELGRRLMAAVGDEGTTLHINYSDRGKKLLDRLGVDFKTAKAVLTII